jgi:hypothetical protein
MPLPTYTTCLNSSRLPVSHYLSPISHPLATPTSQLQTTLPVVSSARSRVMPLAPTSSLDEDVYTGFWINRSDEPLHVATLTLNRQTGGLIIAFLAIFIGTTARSFWKIIRFLLYLSNSTPDSQDGVYHQQQAVLRNSALALDAVLELSQSGLAWRSRANRIRPRITLAVLSATVISIISIVSGIAQSSYLHLCLN